MTLTLQRDQTEGPATQFEDELGLPRNQVEVTHELSGESELAFTAEVGDARAIPGDSHCHCIVPQ